MSSGTLTEPYIEVGLAGWGYIQLTYDQVIESQHKFKAFASLHHHTMIKSNFQELEGFIRFDTIAKKLNDCCGMTLWDVVAVFDTEDHALMEKLCL